MGTRQAVPTGEAHRLPKSVAYVSAQYGEVKTIRAEKRDGASTSALSARQILTRLQALGANDAHNLGRRQKPNQIA